VVSRQGAARLLVYSIRGTSSEPFSLSPDAGKIFPIEDSLRDYPLALDEFVENLL
jgi:hypothetical protein